QEEIDVSCSPQAPIRRRQGSMGCQEKVKRGEVKRGRRGPSCTMPEPISLRLGRGQRRVQQEVLRASCPILRGKTPSLRSAVFESIKPSTPARSCRLPGGLSLEIGSQTNRCFQPIPQHSLAGANSRSLPGVSLS